MTVTVLFFAFAADRMNTRRLNLELALGTTVKTLYERYLAEKLQAPMAQWMFSVNQVWAEPDTELHDGDEVGVIPPVSGG